VADVPVPDHALGSSARVLVVDDENHILRVLRLSLQARGYSVEVAASGREALDLAARLRPELVILDLGLPDMAGAEVIARLRGWSQAPVIVLSGKTADGDKIAAFDAGADDYVAKPFDMDELLARVRAALRRAGAAGDSRPVRIGSHAADLVNRIVTGPGDVVELTPTEWRVLEVLVRRRGQLVTQSELLAEFPDRSHVTESSYLRLHLMHLRHKLEADPARPAHIVTEPGMGYRFIP
jgi:two-component system, OmpR family, KDP operon response regulator KdpE